MVKPLLRSDDVDCSRALPDNCRWGRCAAAALLDRVRSGRSARGPWCSSEARWKQRLGWLAVEPCRGVAPRRVAGLRDGVAAAALPRPEEQYALFAVSPACTNVGLIVSYVSLRPTEPDQFPT